MYWNCYASQTTGFTYTLVNAAAIQIALPATPPEVHMKICPVVPLVPCQAICPVTPAVVAETGVKEVFSTRVAAFSVPEAFPALPLPIAKEPAAVRDMPVSIAPMPYKPDDHPKTELDGKDIPKKGVFVAFWTDSVVGALVPLATTV